MFFDFLDVAIAALVYSPAAEPQAYYPQSNLRPQACPTASGKRNPQIGRGIFNAARGERSLGEAAKSNLLAADGKLNSGASSEVSWPRREPATFLAEPRSFNAPSWAAKPWRLRAAAPRLDSKA